MSKNNIRKIKCTSNCSKEPVINPLTLFPSQNVKESICTTNQINFIDFFSNMAKNCDQKINRNDIIKNMVFPSINFNYKYILKMYNISNIDSLNIWIDNNINNKSPDTIFRVINSWINQNINDLKIFNNGLFDIIKKCLIKFTTIKEQIINKELLNFIDYWINKYDENNFYLNLITDFKKYLNKKYND